MIRIQKQQILEDLNKKIVLLFGPRQSGKTYLAKEIAASFPHSVILNYDQRVDRKVIETQTWFDSTDLLVFDELHKMPNWKDYIKGVFDTRPSHRKILVTGSARLEIYDKVGDSLAGRYFCHHLLPLSLSELRQAGEPVNIERLLERGGFPEPYFAANEIEVSRWRAQYINSLLSTDVFEIKTIQNLNKMRLVLELLREKVGSTVSYRAIAEEVQLAPKTIENYIEILEAIHVVFLVRPYSTNIARSVLKEPKIYFYDGGMVNGNIGAKLENFVAVSLLKNLHAKNDILGQNLKLHYLKANDGKPKEVDFVIANNNVIETLIEVKTSDDLISKGLRYFYDKYGAKNKAEHIQLVHSLKQEYEDAGIKVLKLNKYLSNLYL